jgi:hypothetical protein
MVSMNGECFCERTSNFKDDGPMIVPPDRPQDVFGHNDHNTQHGASHIYSHQEYGRDITSGSTGHLEKMTKTRFVPAPFFVHFF